VLSFNSKFGPLSYPCDRFQTWDDNLRAIALSLEHLRAVDRYGVTKRGEQYQGWAQLPAPPNHKMTREQAVDTLKRIGGGNVTENDWRESWRRAVQVTHPDRGGNAEDFKRVCAAKEALEN
jgi:hypothetical protein